MSYSVQMLASIADCETFLDKLTKEKEDLEFGAVQVSRLRKNYATNAVAISEELQAVESEITTSTSYVEALPEGKKKEKAITELDRRKVRRRVLVGKQKDYGSVALLERELELEFNSAQLTTVNNAIAVVTARKAEL